MTYNFIICDNETRYLNEIERIVRNFSNRKKYNFQIFTFQDYNAKFLGLIRKDLENKIYLLDIKMKQFSGLDAAREIRKIDAKSPIIFITSHENYALKILKTLYNITGFISKLDDNLEEDLVKYLKKLRLMNDKEHYLSFTDNNARYHILMHSILFIETCNRKTVIHIDGEEPIFITISLEKLLEMLDDRFERIHKSCIANMHRVKVINKRNRYVEFDNKEVTDLISRDYKIKENKEKIVRK